MYKNVKIKKKRKTILKIFENLFCKRKTDFSYLYKIIIIIKYNHIRK